MYLKAEAASNLTIAGLPRQFMVALGRLFNVEGQLWFDLASIAFFLVSGITTNFEVAFPQLDIQ